MLADEGGCKSTSIKRLNATQELKINIICSSVFTKLLFLLTLGGAEYSGDVHLAANLNSTP